jgi:predicted type IV restriction endonuclease
MQVMIATQPGVFSMDLTNALKSLQERIKANKANIATEEAAKTAFVMPFLQILGYDVFNPTEVVPEYCADVGTKKGEKVDYAIFSENNLRILIECKPSNSELNINHASQLFRYFSVKEARLAILTNGIRYQFYSDIESPNKMDQKPFFEFEVETLKPSDIRIIEGFSKKNFDIDKIVHEASNLKLQSLIRKELEIEFKSPSPEFVKLLASRVHSGRLTPQVLEKFTKLTGSSISTLIQNLVTDRISSALEASTPVDQVAEADTIREDGVATTEEELEGWRIIQAICAQKIDVNRVVMRDQKSYCGILLDDNNRKSLARLYFNSATVKYLGTFVGKEEVRNQITSNADIFKFQAAILDRINELES